MRKKAVVLVIDKYSEPVHINRLVCGVKHPKDKNFYSILADLSNILEGTEIFFYKRRIDEDKHNRGFIGIFEATSEAFRDPNHIDYSSFRIYGECPHCGQYTLDSFIRNNNRIEGLECKNCNQRINHHILPLRVLIKEKHFYQRYLDDNTAYIDITDEGRLNTLIFRKLWGAGRERSVTPILPEEAEKLERLLQRVEQEQRNNLVLGSNVNFTSYSPIQSESLPQLLYQMECDENGKLQYESMLEFYAMYALGHADRSTNFNKIKNIFSPYQEIEWYGNQVLFGIGGESSDVVISYINSEGIRYRVDVVELKNNTINEDACLQVYNYVYWIAQLMTGNIQNRVSNPFYIKPIVIGHSIKRGFDWNKIRDLINPQNPYISIPYSTPLEVHLLPIEIWTYKCNKIKDHLDIDFEKVDTPDYSQSRLFQ